MQKPDDLRPLLQAYLKERLEEDRAQHLSTPPMRPVYANAAWMEDHEDPIDADLSLIDWLLDDANEALARRDPRTVKLEVDRLMDEQRIPEDLRSALTLGLLRVNTQTLQQARRNLLGGVVDSIVLPTPESVTSTLVPGDFVAASPVPQAPNSPRFSAAVKEYSEHTDREGSWKGQTRKQNTTTYRMFIAHFGDLPVQEITKRHLGEFRTLLARLPKLYSKDKRWRELSLAEAAEASSPDTSIKRLSKKTISRHFAALGGLFSYLCQSGLYEGQNPSHGFAGKRKTRARDERKAWPLEQLQKLFSSPAWSGCASEKSRHEPGHLMIKDGRYWLPILGIYHGNRLEEFAQLRREDIDQVDGIWFAHIRGGGGRQIKNQQSERRVPLHPKVIELGFLDHVLATSDGPIFPELKPQGPDAKVGTSFTKWFTPYRRRVDVYAEEMNYHSFRHNVTTMLFAARVPEHIVDELTGHKSGGSESRTRYLKEVPLQHLYEAISMVRWPGLFGEPA